MLQILFGMDAEKYPDAKTHVAGWRGHNDGQMALVLMRGPGGLRSGAGHQLFADGRLNMVGITSCVQNISLNVCLQIVGDRKSVV